jgi:hypothetical protein
MADGECVGISWAEDPIQDWGSCRSLNTGRCIVYRGNGAPSTTSTISAIGDFNSTDYVCKAFAGGITAPPANGTSAVANGTSAAAHGTSAAGSAPTGTSATASTGATTGTSATTLR